MQSLKHSTDGKTLSLWHQTSAVEKYPPLTKPTSTDVCVVGGGISGLTTAYLLLKEGKRVIVLDDSPIGDGQTGRTSAHLASAIDDRFADINRKLGEDAGRLAYHSHSAAIDLIEQISHAENIDCDFARVDGYLFCSPTDPQSYLDEEFDAAIKIGVAVERVPRIPVNSFDSGPALRFLRQARFHPGKYLMGLCKAIENMGGIIHTGTQITDVEGADLDKGEFCTTQDQRKITVSSTAVVVATNTPTPINDWAGIYTKQASYRTYVITCKIPKGSVTDALYWDTGDANRRSRPYMYVRLDTTEIDHDLLIVGGEDHKTGQMKHADDPFAALERWTRAHFPQATEIVHRWSGQVQEPADGIAYIGVAPHKKPNVYVITGDSGMGLTHGTLGAKLITDLIMKRSNPWTDLYDPSRKATHAPVEFAKENLNAAATLTEYVTPGEVSSADDILPGDGALVRSGLKKLAVYRDDDGKVHQLSSVCPHMGCVVQWNPIEKTWDCPCHGSRFDCRGKVVMGPSIDDLSPVNPE